MELKETIIDALKNKKNKVDIATMVSDITLDAMVKIAIRDSGVKVAYNIKRLGTMATITFSYPTEMGAIKRDGIPPVVKEKASSLFRSCNKEVHIYDKGGDAFINEIDIRRGNIFYIHTPFINNTVKLFNDRMLQIIGTSEGVVSYNYNIDDSTSENVFRLILNIKMDYPEFIRRIDEGEKKAKEIYHKLTNNASLPPEVKCLLAYAYMQKNTKYDYPYMKTWTKVEDQIVDNHTCYGSLVLKKAVCEGYSWGLIKLLREAGIEAVPVTGNHDGTGHEWTKVRINGHWYNLDCTLDPVDEGIVLGPFLVSDACLLRNGYVFDPFGRVADDPRYESDINIRNFFAQFMNDLEKYHSLGVDPTYLDINYYKLPLK